MGNNYFALWNQIITVHTVWMGYTDDLSMSCTEIAILISKTFDRTKLNKFEEQESFF